MTTKPMGTCDRGSGTAGSTLAIPLSTNTMPKKIRGWSIVLSS